MVLDYLSSNALNKYPFEDTCSLKSTAGATLSNSHFLDLLVVAKIPAAGVFLHQYSVNSSSLQFTLGFTLFNESGNTVSTANFVIPFASVAEKQFYGVANDDFALKVVFGSSFVADKTSNYSLTFTKPNTTLAQSAFVPVVPKVKSLKFFNWNKSTNLANTTPLATFTGSELVNLDLMLQEGANVAFTPNETAMAIDVLPGAGTGLFDACSDELLIRSINSIGPDVNKNFVMQADDCYVVTPVDHGIYFDNICTPKCTSEQFSAFAYYINRIRDGMASIFSLASMTYTNLRDEIERYKQDVVPNKNKPSYKVEIEQFSTVDADRFYYSIAVGCFNPTNDPISLYINIVTSGTLVKSQFRIDNDTTIVDNNLITTSIPCMKTCIVEIIISGPEGGSVALTGDIGGEQIYHVADLT